LANNTTGTVPLLAPAFGFTGPNAADFTQTNNCGASIAVGASCTINVVFTPHATGTRTATMTIAYTGSTGIVPGSVGLSGTGTVSESLSPNPLSFGINIATGSAAIQKSVTLTNNDLAAVTITTPAIPAQSGGSGSYTLGTGTNSCASGTLAAGASCTIYVTYTPGAAAGTRSGTLSVVVDGAPQNSALTAATVLPTMTPNPVAFGTGVFTGSSVISKQVTMTNNSASVVTIGSTPVVQGQAGGSGNYAYVPTGSTCTNGATIAAGGTCVINVTYTPGATGAAPGTRTANLNVTVNGSTVTDQLTVTTVQALTASPATLAFGTVARGASALAQTVTFTNTSTSVSLTLGTIALSGNGTNASEYSWVGSGTKPCASGLPLALGEACTIDVTFKPSLTIGTGSKPATLTVNSNAPATTVSLTGTAN
jgi:hypothetical protein